MSMLNHNSSIQCYVTSLFPCYNSLMKKIQFPIYITLLVAIISFIPVLSHAQNATANPNNSIRQRIRTGYETRVQNAANNVDYRNNLLQGRRIGTSTNMMSSTSPMMPRNFNSEDRTLETRIGANASSTSMFQDQRENQIRNLNQALQNLKQIRNRIASRIEKEVTAGKDMSEASTSLQFADNKILVAEDAVRLFASSTHTITMPQIQRTASSTLEARRMRLATSTSMLVSSSMHLPPRDNRQQPEQNPARKAINDAQKALNDTVSVIAKILGVKLPPPNEPPQTPPISSTPNNKY